VLSSSSPNIWPVSGLGERDPYKNIKKPYFFILKQWDMHTYTHTYLLYVWLVCAWIHTFATIEPSLWNALPFYLRITLLSGSLAAEVKIPKKWSMTKIIKRRSSKFLADRYETFLASDSKWKILEWSLRILPEMYSPFLKVWIRYIYTYIHTYIYEYIIHSLHYFIDHGQWENYINR